MSEWTMLLDRLLEHPYWFDFQGALFRSRRVNPLPLSLKVDGTERHFDIRAQYILEFAGGPFDSGEDAYNAFRLSLGEIVRIQSVFRDDERLYVAQDIFTAAPQDLERLENVVVEWSALPRGIDLVICAKPPPHSRQDFVELLKEYVQ